MSTHCQRRLAQAVSLLLCCAISNCVRGDVLSPLNFQSLGTLSLAGGSFTFDTDALTIYDNAAPNTPLFTGVIDDQGGMAQPGVVPEIAVFAFDAIDLDPSATVTISGTRAIALLSHSDATIGTALSVDGQASTAAGTEGAVSPGGFAGGVGNRQPGDGPGGGQPNISGSNTWSIAAGMGSFGGAGISMGTPGDALYSAPGETYGDLTQLLQGGSGGASSNQHGAGGGGAIELGAVGTLRIEALVTARGGNATTTPFLAVPGAGSGGGILLSGADVVLHALVSAPGGSVSSTFTTVPKAAGGGRVLIQGGPTITTLDALEAAAQYLANVDVKSTTPAYNSNPIDPLVSRANQGVISLSPNLTLVGDGETLPLGQAVDLSTPTENIELRHRDARFAVGATANVGNGYSSPYLIELTHPTARIVGAGPLFNAAELRGTGTIEVEFINDAGAQVNATNDTLIFTQAATNNAGGQINAINSTLDFQAGLTNDGQLNLINTTILGSINGGAGGAASLVGDNTVGGNLAMTAADSLAIRLGGAVPAQFDSLTVGGDLALAGSLAVSLTGGFTLAPSQSFTIVDIGGTASGNFTGLAEGELVGTFGGTDLFITYTAGNGNDVALFTAGLPGDYNNDGRVDAGDYVRWRNHLGEEDESALHNNGDGNDVSLSDYTWWKQHYGNPGTGIGGLPHLAPPGAPGPGAEYAVPEPSGLALLAAAPLVLFACRPSVRRFL